MSNFEETNLKNENEFVIFLIGDQEYCIDIMSLREIRGWTSATALPDSPEYVRGVINLRGAVVPIIDLASKLGLPQTIQSERSVIMITNIGDQVIGLLADAVIDILAIDPEAVQAPPQLSSGETNYFISGLVAMEERMISVIDLDNLLPAHEQIIAA